MLSPHAELSSTSKTSAALTALLALLRLSACPASGSSGLGGRLSADANCQSPSAGVAKGDAPGLDLMGEAVGVCCIELALLRAGNVSSPGGDGARPSEPRRSGACRSCGEKRGLPGADCWARCASVMSSSSMKISGTVNCGIVAMRPCFFWSMARRKRRAQYNVSKKPITTFRRTASSTRCRRARRRKNSSNLCLCQPLL
jgi:hypothetical protein